VHPLYGLIDAKELRLAIHALLERGDDAELQRALMVAPAYEECIRLWSAVSDAANHVDAVDSSAVVARIFALPLVIVTGSPRPATVPGVVPDIGAIAQIFEQHGALGPSRNFGLGNALCSLDTLESVRFSELYTWTRNPGATRRELLPAAVEIAEPGEHVHLRFIVGAAIAPAAEPSFVETASNIGKWGMPLTRALASQLSQASIEVLPLARPPQDLLRAAQAGRYAQLEAAFNLFASNAVRRVRSATGDPDAVVSAHDSGEIRIGLSSPFDIGTVEGFRWPLHPLDDLAGVTASIVELLAACRITSVRLAQAVLPALNAQGHVWYPRGRDLDAIARPH
jgi:hypothetical protein